MHIHKWSAWQDVKVAEKTRPDERVLVSVVREVIVQQRRCSVCNLVKTRHS
jgi:hypothetical protein